MAKKKSRQKKGLRKPSASQRAKATGTLPRNADLGVPRAEVKRFMALYDARRLQEAEAAARELTQQYPQSAFAWKALGTTLLEGGRVDQALEHLHRSVELNDTDPLSLTSLAAVYYQQGDNDQAVRYQSRAVELQPDYAPAQYRLAEMLQSAGKQFKALEHAKQAQELGYDDFRSRVLLGSLLYQTKYFSGALEIYRRLEQEYPGSAPVYNNLGNLYKDIGQYQLSEAYYQKAMEERPDYVMAYSNIFFAKHYNPEVTQQEIIDFAKGWDARFALPALPSPTNRRDPAKPLRVGLISSGFRIHPVGQMIATALEHSRPDIHYYAYSTNDHDDHVTHKIREATRVWRPIRHLGQEAVAQLIRDDAIDVLIDLSGHGDGSCLQAISMRPAPICIKWVGGLVNTMGVESIDYLLSDAIETPEGVDDQYTEKLIRLPDDYICYMPCPYAPSTTSLPAIKNHYVTLGCLNNPAKISDKLLAEWAKLMHELPESRLLLRGAQYESEDFCRWIRDTLADQGIDAHRVILEGPAKHQEFLETYQRIDIALDTWPYSGGLTTCEALLMGVPVVTLPGPTFAGRHSATHLINAGLQELVTSSWEEYRQRVLELANDLPNLAVIRAGLRTILHYSPVCDAPRFANHFNNALRAVWVRYCEEKSPEALTFNKEGELWFEDDKQPIELPEARSEEKAESEAFQWQLDEPITIIDNAAVLPRHPDYAKWMASGHLAVISFDPASLLNNRVEELQEHGELHHYPHALLGDGQPATLYATLDAEKGSTLKPLPETQQPEYLRDKLKVLAELPINTVRLDDIEGLPSVDMLVLDDLHDAMKVLENGEQTLKNTLLIQVKVVFQPTHERQPSLAEVQHWMAFRGFRFYRFNDEQYRSHLPDSIPVQNRQATELVSTDAIFLPSHERTSLLSDAQRTKLAFMLHTVFGAKDMAYYLLKDVSGDKAGCYLNENWLARPLNNNMRKGGRAIDSIQEVANYLREASISSFRPNHSLPGSLVVSLTSYSSRFDNLYLTLRSLMLQEVSPDHLILWIAEEEKKELPKNVWELEQYGLNIRFCENIRSYKKIVPSLREYPDSFIVTADDDLYYDSKWLKGLVDSWDGDERTVIAHRAHKVVLNDKGRPLPYKKWKWEVGEKEPVDGLIFPTSGAGVLWPPHVFHSDVTYVRRFMELCPSADDIWLYWMASLNGAKVKRSTYEFRFIEWPNNGVSPLWKENVIGGGNDRQIEKLMGFYSNPFFVSREVEASKGVSFFYAGEKVSFFLPNERDHIQKIIKGSSSFYELKMLEDIRSRVSAGGVILDVGANIGNHSVYFGMFCEASKVFSFEPHPSIYKVLERNVSENGLSDKVVCCNFGVGEKDGKATVSFYDESNVGMSRLEVSGGGDVKVVSLDGFCEELGVDVDLIKIDVEGMEPDVIKGASRVIDKFSPILYVEAGDSTAFEKVNFILEGYGYEPVAKFNATATYLFLKGGFHV